MAIVASPTLNGSQSAAVPGLLSRTPSSPLTKSAKYEYCPGVVGVKSGESAEPVCCPVGEIAAGGYVVIGGAVHEPLLNSLKTIVLPAGITWFASVVTTAWS